MLNAPPSLALMSLSISRRRSHRFRSFPARGAIETIESGARESPFSLTVYDKRRQLFDQHEIALGSELTRIEMRIKQQFRLRELGAIDNPFRDVTLHFLEPQRDQRSGLKIAIRAARLVGLARMRPFLSETQWRSLLGETEAFAAAHVVHPARVFDEAWLAAARRLLRQLGLR